MKRRLVFVLFASCLAAAARAQVNSGDAELDKRLETYLALNQRLDFDALLHYVHPRLFTIAPREDVLDAFRLAFNNEALTIRIDSLNILSVSEAFFAGDTSYRLITYRMNMQLRFRDSTIYDRADFEEEVMSSLEESVPEKSMQFDRKNKRILIDKKDTMLAMRDHRAASWYFIVYEAGEPRIRALFPERVVAHFGLL